MSKKTDRKRKFSEVEPGDQSKSDISCVNVVLLVESRAQEITSLNHHVQTKTVNKMVLETLPKHMNRRAMAHDIRRWPRRLRHLVKKQYENQGTKRLRRPPSRKHRRRPSNLLAEYNRRKKKHVWLETHIWHAKRFLMTKKWGYHLAKRPTCKTNRRTYNSVMKYCLLQDVSFLCCIEITGPESEIIAGFSHLSSPATGPGVGARCYLNGCREGSSVLYKYNQYPHDAIGFVTFLWKPICSVNSSLTEESSSSSSSSSTESEDMRYLWLWCHPSCYNQLWEELVKVFQNVIPAASEHKSSKDVTTEVSQEASDIETSSEAKPDQTTQSSTSSTASQSHSSGAADKKSCVFLKSLKDQLVRFRLTGPLTLKVLSKAINVSEIKIPSSGTPDTPWWHTYFNSEDRLTLHQTKVDLWRSLGAAYVPAELPKHWILGMTVMDPRWRLPTKKQRAVPSLEVHGDDQSIETTPELSMSPLWQESIRTEVKTTKLSEHQFNKIISENTLPGDHQHVQASSSLIPLLLIQRPVIQSTLQSCNSLDPLAGTGCDIILPVGWGMVFWISLVYQGAQVGGLNEACQTSLEIGDLHFPFDFPDTEAGLKEISVIKTKKLDAYLRRPPSKRPNFERLGVPIPFQTDYLSLVQDLNKNSDIQSFCVLRDRKKLIALSRSISSAKDTKLKISSLFVGDAFYKQTIVPVIIEMISKGVPGHNSMICVPRKEDLVNLKSKKSKSVEEPLHKNKRTKTEKDDKKKIKTSRLCEAKLKDGTGQLLELSKTSRKIIGFLTKGKYSFLKSSGVGIGFCSIVGLEDLLANSKNIVLVRSIQSLEYRYAKLSILS